MKQKTIIPSHNMILNISKSPAILAALEQKICLLISFDFNRDFPGPAERVQLMTYRFNLKSQK